VFKIMIIEKIKRRICDRLIVLLANFIQKCSKKEEFIIHLENIESNKLESQKFREIYSKKDDLYHAVNLTKIKINCLENYNNELLIAIRMTQNSIMNNDIEKALKICNKVLEIDEK